MLESVSGVWVVGCGLLIRVELRRTPPVMAGFFVVVLDFQMEFGCDLEAVGEDSAEE